MIVMYVCVLAAVSACGDYGTETHLPKVLRVSILLAKEERNEEESSRVTECNVAAQYVNFVG